MPPELGSATDTKPLPPLPPALEFAPCRLPLFPINWLKPCPPVPPVPTKTLTLCAPLGLLISCETVAPAPALTVTGAFV